MGPRSRRRPAVTAFTGEKALGEHLELARQRVKELEEETEEVSQRIEKAQQRARREKQKRLDQALEELGPVSGSGAGRGISQLLDQSQVGVIGVPRARVGASAGGGVVDLFYPQPAAVDSLPQASHQSGSSIKRVSASPETTAKVSLDPSEVACGTLSHQEALMSRLLSFALQ